MATAITCSALLGLLLFALGLGVSMQRGRSNTLSGHAADPADPLHRWVRAHGNTAEYAPMFAVLFLIAGMRNSAPWMLWVVWIATVSRYLIAAGIIVAPMDKPQPLRFAGAIGTYISGIVLSVALLLGF